ncbi:uncharacterized protein [Phyllobates terribilis]|uniref:uncharacterized protein n=1 Tax=Phyllobates terribilis TaxID=111132 RepID=UPI003CCA8CFE
MKDLGKTKLCLGLQIEHLDGGIFVHQSNYTERILRRFNMDKAHSLSSPIDVRSLNVDKDQFRPTEEDEEVIGPEVPYLSTIGGLMYLTNNTRPDISFSVNLFSIFSSTPTRRHWNGIKHIFRYHRGTHDLGLFSRTQRNAILVGYANEGYLSDPHKAKSQNGYVFTYGGITISWKSNKQTVKTTSSNQAELIALYEAGRKCVALRTMITFIQKKCGVRPITSEPTFLYEDNSACIA